MTILENGKSQEVGEPAIRFPDPEQASTSRDKELRAAFPGRLGRRYLAGHG